MHSRPSKTVETIVAAVERRFGQAQGVWVMDRGMVSKETLRFLSRPGSKSSPS